MPAKSKAQQKFMGMVHAYKKGEIPASKVSKAVKDAAKSMKKKSTKDYASTKHDDLPNKVREYLMSENPAASAAAAMAMMKLQNPDTGKKVSAVTPLKNKDHKLHGKAKSIFKRLKDKLSKKKPEKKNGVVHNFMRKNESVNERKVKMTKYGTIHVSEVPSYQKAHYPTQKHWDYYQSLPKGKKHMYYKKYPEVLAKASKQTDDFIAQQKKKLGLESVNEVKKGQAELFRGKTGWMLSINNGKSTFTYDLGAKDRKFRGKGNNLKTTEKQAKQFAKKLLKHPDFKGKIKLKESVNEAKLKLTKDKPKKITKRIWSAPKRIMTKRAYLNLPYMVKLRKNGVDYVNTPIGPNNTMVYLPVIFESVNEISGIDLAKKVVKNKQHEKGMDLFTAQYIVQTYDAYKKHPELRKKIEKLSVPKAVKLANLVMKGR